MSVAVSFSISPRSIDIYLSRLIITVTLPAFDSEWLGHHPSRVTYSSDYFKELYEFAEQLVNQGDAYVCGQSQAEVKVSFSMLVLLLLLLLLLH